jgi:hypothetical protein
MPSLLLFAWRKALTDSGLPAPVRHTALALSSYMDTDGSNAHPAIETLAHDVGRHPESVRRHLRHLEGTGWLLVEPSKGGRHRTNRWHAHIPHRAQPSPNGSQPVDNPPETAIQKPPHQRGGTKRNPRTSVEKPPHPCGGISYYLPTTYAYQQLLGISARRPVDSQPPTHATRAPPHHHTQEAA